MRTDRHNHRQVAGDSELAEAIKLLARTRRLARLLLQSSSAPVLAELTVMTEAIATASARLLVSILYSFDARSASPVQAKPPRRLDG